jgi:sugar phosphate isomerase/epimerase
MSRNHPLRSVLVHRRQVLRLGVAGLSSLALEKVAGAQQPKAVNEQAIDKSKPTKFQIACMTLAYSRFPLERALTGLKEAGYRYVAWGTNHREPDGKQQPLMPEDAPPEKAKDLGKRCRDLGLEPLMMFSGVYPEAKNHKEVLTSRVRQAAAAGIPQVLTFGNPRGGDRKLWVEQFKQLGPVARDHGVLIVVKQHGGLTASGVLSAELIRDVADEGIKVNYDSGNVMDYLKLDAPSVLADFQKCGAETRSFCIKDHRLSPKDEDCGPGFGEIDHYKLLQPVAFTGRSLPLCCENIFAPLLPRPAKPEDIDALARRAREFLEVVVQGLQA